MKDAKLELIAFLIFTFFSLCLQKAEWKGSIEEQDGVKVIKNPNEPLYGEIEFELEEDLSIGNERDENYMFYRVKDIEVNEQGNIFIADMSNHRIQKFDKYGNYLHTIGRKGQGPGEFERPWRVRIDNNGNIYVADGSFTIEVFKKDGNPLKSVKLEKSIQDFWLCEKGSIIGVFHKLADIEMIPSICKANAQGEIVETYSEFPSNYYIRRDSGGGIGGGIITGYEKELMISKINDQSFVFGYSGDYELRVIDEKGLLLYKIKRESLPKKLPSRLKDLNLGKYQPYFFLILSDSKGRIYVQTNKTWNEDVEKKEIDIFSKDGFYLYKTRLPKHTFVIKDGYLYTLEVKDDEIIKRYKIKNWEQIREQ